MVLVLNISVEETASLQVRCSMWVRDRPRRYDEGGLEGMSSERLAHHAWWVGGG